MEIKVRIKRILEGLDLEDMEVKILENHGTRVLASIISPAFQKMNEADRQAMVWGKLLDDLGDYESRRVEFVFTDTPREIAKTNANEAAADDKP